MKLKFKLNLEKKHKYLILAVFISVLVFLFSMAPFQVRAQMVALTLLVLCVGIFVTQYPNITWQNYAFNLLIPIHLLMGVFLSLIYFPALSIPFKVGAIISFGIVFYTYLLVNNVFLVVEDKEQTIPLYRVALTWMQILMIIIAIPYFAGVFKLPANLVVQNGLAAASTFLFANYIMSVLRYDSDSKNLGIGERGLLGFFAAFLVFAAATAVSFIPTESFLRSIYISSFLMFGLNYIQVHLRNAINKRFFREYVFIFTVFLVLLLVFKP